MEPSGSTTDSDEPATGEPAPDAPGPAPAAEHAPPRVVDAAHFAVRLDEELAHAERSRSPLALIALWIEAPPTDVEKAASAVAALRHHVASAVRAADVIGERPGGAFVLSPSTNDAGARALVARLSSLLAGTPLALGDTARLRIGAATFPDDGGSIALLLGAAEHDAATVPPVAATGEATISAASSAVPPHAPAPSPVAASARMRELVELADRVAASKLTVLISGESGVGKKRLADYLCERSDRRARPRIVLDLGAVPEQLVEVELFGYEEGAFTDAPQPARGKLELAAGGTLILDEVGELPLSAQVKLLRFLDEQRFYRLGAAEPRPADVRVLALTHRDLHADVAAGRFREELLQRLGVVSIKIPPLRERPEDIPPLVDRLISDFAARSSVPSRKLALEAFDLLYAHPFPGNVSELRTVIERAMVEGALGSQAPITGDDLINVLPDLSPKEGAHRGDGGAGAMRSESNKQREQGVLDLIRRHPDIGLQEILKELGASKSTGIRVINDLIARGQVVRRDRGKRSRYRLV